MSATTVEQTNGHINTEQRVVLLEERINTLADIAEEARATASNLRRALAEAEERAERAEAATLWATEEGEAKLEAFKVRASEILAEQANDHDLCETYDNIAESAGLYRRPYPVDVEVEVTFRQTITLRSRSWQDAKKEVAGFAISAYWEPSHPFTGDDIEDAGAPYSVQVKVVD